VVATLLGLLACTGSGGLESLPGTDTVLGWRLVPGQQLRYRLTTTWEAEDQNRARVEDWTYTVTGVDGRGVAELVGRLTAFGVALDQGGEALTEDRYARAREAERDRRGAEPVGLVLSMDGRLVDVAAGEWSDALPHHVLGLRLPESAVAPGASWPDPTLARPFADLWPPTVDLEVDGHHTLEGLYREAGVPLAKLVSQGAAGPGAGDLPPIRLEGEAWWDLRVGRLASRSLAVTWETGDGAGPGTLLLDLKHVD